MSRDARRTQLLAAAQDVFVTNGYHAAAMDDIAERAGVSKPVLYQHFPGKMELYLALLDGHVTELVDRVRAAISSTTDNKSRVRAAIGAYYDFVDREGGAFKLIFESDLRSQPDVRDRVDQANQQCADAITELIAEDAGLDADRAGLIAVALVGVSQVTARHWLSNNRALPKDEAVNLMSTLAWRGIAGFPLTH
jgi:AcrR family transcriptional regulator